ncbi:MAG: hypothetical protein HY656_07250 [Acidobacteria bacterium]|nr:hypothetical protein [Acidobacteriota bacterium]
MTRPEKIPVKYSEDLAQFADLRPVVRQPMTLEELVGLVLATAGKHPGRVRELLRSGTCVYNIYRYWWESFEIDDFTLDAVLARFPDPNPAQPFRGAYCLWARLADATEPKPHTVTFEKPEAEPRRWFRRQSFWDFLLDLASAKQPAYLDYSYYHRADLYRAALNDLDRTLLRHHCARLASRALQRRLASRADWAWLELACSR